LPVRFRQKLQKSRTQNSHVEHIELRAKLLDYFLHSNKSNINQSMQKMAVFDKTELWREKRDAHNHTYTSMHTHTNIHTSTHTLSFTYRLSIQVNESLFVQLPFEGYWNCNWPRQVAFKATELKYNVCTFKGPSYA